MGVLRPFLQSEDARTQAEFYIEALGGELVSVITFGQATGTDFSHKDKVMHLCVHVAGGNAIFMADSLVPYTPDSGIALNLTFKSVEEARDAFTKLAVGGHISESLELQPFGMYYGELIDRYGVSWMIAAEA
ncbi:VOC family protein [Xylanibacillus composti]|uniref:PhnB-like domain-containing protein n=1 Tax=Xylanibacillus composti TaxID=1572762 RepID=A0A8J4M4M5_9BACL|nr:VOC family protein [Xylanibacillus composti]MDT9726413.1 VOC family protein [Xylanibacillus composti]GIQ71437.1 hypothetical protein XYCOK13_42610 [Xylanibacillus composti]